MKGGSNGLFKIKDRIKLSVFSVLTCISPRLSTVIQYRYINKRFPNLKDPKSFSEKLSWLKLYSYGNDPLVAECSDKVAVREYVERSGCGSLLNEVYGIYDEVDSIPWDSLPRQFVLKWNFGSGYNILNPGGAQFDKAEAAKKLKRWEKIKYWNYHAEFQYRSITPKIVCERYLNPPDGSELFDYKLYSFDGKVLAILVVGRSNGVAQEAAFMSPDWEYLSDIPSRYNKSFLPERPASLDEMIQAATVLSEPFPFVRVDFYESMGHAVFGEMTFTPAAGLNPSETMIKGRPMGEYIHLKKQSRHGLKERLKKHKVQNGIVKRIRIGSICIPYHRFNHSGIILPFPISKREILSDVDSRKKRNYSDRQSLDENTIKSRLCDEYMRRLGKELNLTAPVSFTEKINWLKLNYKNPLITRCCDKYTVKSYIYDVLGKDFSTQTYHVWKKAEDIDFDVLPDSFALKVNWSSGYNIFVYDKTKLKKYELELIRAQISVWLLDFSNSYYDSFNWGYKNVRPLVYAEELLPDSFVSNEYKVFCFDGKPEFTLVELEPNSSNPSRVCVDNSGQRMPFCFGAELSGCEEYSVPQNFNELLYYSRKLASGFPCVRVDFMTDGSRIVIGEMTFYSGGGFSHIIPDEWDNKIGELIDISKV